MADTRSAFEGLSYEEIILLVRDIRDSKRNGRRVEKLVLYAKEIYAKLNVDTENPTVTLRQCLEIAQSYFLEELFERILNGMVSVNTEESRSEVLLKNSVEHIVNFEDDMAETVLKKLPPHAPRPERYQPLQHCLSPLLMCRNKLFRP